jgi:hypothetical protein
MERAAIGNFGVDPLALGIEPYRHRGARAEGSEKIVIRSRSSVLTTDRNRLIRHEQMTSARTRCWKRPLRSAHLDHTVG